MQGLREHYESQDTEELLDIARKDLTEEARATLHKVLASRGVASGMAEAAREAAITREVADLEAEKHLASLWVRFLAFAIDVGGAAIVLGAALWPLRFVSFGLYDYTVIGLFWLYFLLKDGIPGQSFGKRTLNIRAVRAESGRPCTWSQSLARNVTHILFVVDALFALGRRRMRLGDMIAGTVVVRALPVERRA
jgi:uncharacterized RDD family membrane protein YckC